MAQWEAAVGGLLQGAVPAFLQQQARQDQLAQREIENQRRAEQDAQIQALRDFQMQQAQMQNVEADRGRQARAVALSGGLMGDTMRTPEERAAKYGMDVDPLQYLSPQEVYYQTPEQKQQQSLNLYEQQKIIDAQYAQPPAPKLQVVELDNPAGGGKAGKYLLDLNSGRKEFLGGKELKVPEGIDFKKERDLRKEFSSEADNFKKITNSYQTIQSIAKEPSAAGDIGLVFSIMKMFDPGSVVRESEFATAQNAAGVPDRLRAQYNRILSGERLTPEQRADFVGTADRIYQGQRSQFDALTAKYTELARQYHMDPERIVYDFGKAIKADAVKMPDMAAKPEGVDLVYNPETGEFE